MLISSAQNPKIKQLKKLEKSAERREQGVFLIEGMRELCLAVWAGYEVTQIFICPELVKETDTYNLRSCADSEAEVYTLSAAVYESLTYRDGTEGVIATARPKTHSLDALKLPADPLILVIEGVEKPGNLGAMLRTCNAAGADAVIVCDMRTDVYNPNVVRSSIGTVFTNQIAVAPSNEVLNYLKEKKINVYAASLQATDYYSAYDMRSGTAIAVGTEATGLSEQWMLGADHHVKIPMLGKIDSLNVSVSAAVLLYEAVRQRQVR